MKYKKVAESNRILKRINRFEGVNTNDLIYSLSEKQLSECLNLTNLRGVIENRPGIAYKDNSLNIPFQSNTKIISFKEELMPFNSGGFCKIGALLRQNGSVALGIDFYLIDSNGTVKWVEFDDSFIKGQTYVDNISFVCTDALKGSGIFAVIAQRTLTNQNEQKQLLYYELKSDFEGFVSVDRKELYTPCTWAFLHGTFFIPVTEDQKTERSDEKYEDINILNGAFKVCFSCDGASYAFNVPYKDFSLDDEVIVEYFYGKDESCVFKVLAGQEQAQAFYKDKLITVTVDRSTGRVCFYEGEEYFIPARYLIYNSIRVTGYKYNEQKAYEIFCKPSLKAKCDARLLRIGDGESRNKLFYSGKDNPFYFGENAFISVGDKDKALTAIAAQNRYQFLFKDNEIYRLRMEDSEYYSIKSVVEEYTELTVKKPKTTLTVVHSTIGCDCPKSISFCTNRLVWYHSHGTVYCLYGTNSYTEGSVYALSPSISNELKEAAKNKDNITAATQSGYYYLSAGEKIYVMDAKVSGFRYLSGHKNTAEENGGLAWYIWQMPKDVKVLDMDCSNEELSAFLISTDKQKGKATAFFGCFDGKEDVIITADGLKETRDIECLFASALIGLDSVKDTKLAKVCLDILNENKVKACLLFKSYTGKEFTIGSNKALKTVSLILPMVAVSGAGVRIKAKGKFALSEIALYFEKRR